MNHKPLILISACLLGQKVRYDGRAKQLVNTIIDGWLKQGILVSTCPEIAGGLPTPRPPAEIQHGKSSSEPNQIITINNQDVSDQFQLGAIKTLEKCIKNKIKMAILTDGSPSCGSATINDGNFNKNKIAGEGITTSLLRLNGIKVFNQNQLELASQHYQQLSTQQNKEQHEGQAAY